MGLMIEKWLDDTDERITKSDIVDASYEALNRIEDLEFQCSEHKMKYEQWEKTISTPQPYAMYNATTVRKLVDRIEELEEWIAAIADDHPQIPDWIQQSARSLLAQESEF